MIGQVIKRIFVSFLWIRLNYDNGLAALGGEELFHQGGGFLGHYAVDNCGFGVEWGAGGEGRVASL